VSADEKKKLARIARERNNNFQKIERLRDIDTQTRKAFYNISSAKVRIEREREATELRVSLFIHVWKV